MNLVIKLLMPMFLAVCDVVATNQSTGDENPINSAQTIDSENTCPLCALYHEPNEETVMAMTADLTNAKRITNLDEMFDD